MPRKSRAAIERDLFLKPLAARPTSPELSGDIPANVRQLMETLISSQPEEHWTDGDEYLVEQFAQSILSCREADAHLRVEGYVLKNGRANPWLIVWEKATRASVALAAKLRLAPQQRHDAKAAARELHERPSSLGITYRQMRGQ